MPGWPRGHIAFTTLSFALTLACGYEVHNDHSSDGCPAGSAGCPCAEDGGCDSELECVDGSCQPGVGGSTTTALTTTTSVTVTSTTTGTGGAETGPLTGATTDACEFICDTDAPASTPECDIFAQDCPEGQKCAAYDSKGNNSWNSAKCVEVMGDGQHGDPCTADGGASGIDDCAEGVMCWNLNEEGVGECVALCGGTPENPICEPYKTHCEICCDGVVNLCLPVCDPLLQDCEGAQLCVPDPYNYDFVCLLDASGGMGPVGTPCEFANVCNAGLACVEEAVFPAPDCSGAMGCCAPFCDFNNGDNDCQGLPVEDAVCVAYYGPGEAPSGLEHIGICGVIP